MSPPQRGGAIQGRALQGKQACGHTPMRVACRAFSATRRASSSRLDEEHPRRPAPSAQKALIASIAPGGVALPRRLSAARGVAAAATSLQEPEVSVPGEAAEDLEEQAAAAAAAVVSEQAALKALPRWEVVADEAHAGGRLHTVRLEGNRMLRVWLPPGYLKHVSAAGGHPVLYLNDGQNLFDDSLCFSGCSWRAGEAAAALIGSGSLPPFVIVGIDHSGATRSLDYCPVVPGTAPGNFRLDAKDWPGGGVDAYIDLVMDTIIPWATKEYNLATDKSLRAFGGSSFGGICTLSMAMRYPDAFGSVIVESPSLWIDNAKFLEETITNYAGEWPQKIFMAMGGKEYSAIRKNTAEEQVFDEYLVKYATELAAIWKKQGLGPDRLMWRIDEPATHTESAWMKRLPHALSFLCQEWWKPLAELHEEALFFCSPLRPVEGQPYVMFFQKSRCEELRDSEVVKLHVGYNNWSQANAVAEMQPSDSLTKVSGATWWKVTMEAPLNVHDMEFVFSDKHHQTWVNSNGENFWKRIEAGEYVRNMDNSELRAQAIAQVEGDAQVTAHKHATCLYFTVPSRLVGGAPAKFFFNRTQSIWLRHSQNLRLTYGFDGWQNVQTVGLHGTQLWRDERQDWCSVTVEVPENAQECNFSFTDGNDAWENNDGNDYTAIIKTSAVREVDNEEINDHASGKMHVLTLSKPRGMDAKAARAARWTTEKTVRVWTPPGHSVDNPPTGGWPVIIFNDGQNKFEDWLAHQGVSWRVGDCASHLITSGRLPPFVVVAIDNSGPMRSLNYLPYPPGSGVGGFRGDAERWPGGGVDNYMHRVVDDILPMLTKRFALASHPSRVAFGGGSFGGICALYASMHYSHVFGTVLAESPSLWIAEGRFLHDLGVHTGPLPERLFIGCGTKEYSATRDHVRDDMDELLFHYYREAERILREKGMTHGRFKFQVEEGAGHHEAAWAWRLTGALEFLLAPWWGRY